MGGKIQMVKWERATLHSDHRSMALPGIW